MGKIESVTIIGPVVWGSVWGHGPELARYLAGCARVIYLNPVVPRKATAPSFQERGAYPVPEGVQVVSRQSSFSAGLLYGLVMEWKNLRDTMSSDPDCLITYYPVGSLLALLWSRLRGRRSVFVFADFPDIMRHRLARFAARSFGIRVSAWLATAGSLATSRGLHDDLRKVTSRNLYVPNGVNLLTLDMTAAGVPGREKSPASGVFTAGFVGFFGDWVDFELLFQAASLCPDIRFLVVGDGPEREKIVERAVNLKNVEFTGPVQHNEVFRLIREMDTGLIPFKVNRITDRVSPVKLFEYWAMGKPVLATGCRELRLMAESWPGAVTIFSSALELADSLEKLRREPMLAQKASTVALQAVKNHDWQILGKKILDFLEGKAGD